MNFCILLHPWKVVLFVHGITGGNAGLQTYKRNRWTLLPVWWIAVKNCCMTNTGFNSHRYNIESIVLINCSPSFNVVPASNPQLQSFKISYVGLPWYHPRFSHRTAPSSIIFRIYHVIVGARQTQRERELVTEISHRASSARQAENTDFNIKQRSVTMNNW